MPGLGYHADVVTTYVVLAATAFVTSALSAVLGMGGGSLLLVTTGGFLSHAETISAHATVQVFNLSVRTLAFWRHVHWPTILRFSAGSVPGALVGGWLLWAVGSPAASEPYLKGSIGLYILAVTFLPRSSDQTASGREWEWTVLGLAAGASGLFVGAVGPLIAPLFVRHAILKEKLIATKALCQAILHVIKLPILLAVRDFRLVQFSLLLALMVAATVPGTLLGKWLLGRVPERVFLRLYQAALVITAGKLLVVDGVIVLLRP